MLYLVTELLEKVGYFCLSVRKLQPYEFLNGSKSWERGAGMCGELASIVIYMLDEVGVGSAKAGLAGHVIALAETGDGTNYIVDADYGFVLQGTLDEISRNRVHEIELLNASKGSNHAKSIVEIYGPEGNIIYGDGEREYRPKAYWFETVSYMLKWLIPVVLLAISFLLYPFSIREEYKLIRTDPGSVTLVDSKLRESGPDPRVISSTRPHQA